MQGSTLPALFRPLLEYCVKSQALHFNKDVEKLKNTQKQAITLILNASHIRKGKV